MTAVPGSQLSAAQLDAFQRNGYLVIPDALDATAVRKLLSATRQMLADFPLNEHPLTKFSTGQGKATEHVGDDYFLTSGDKVRFFFEEDAFDAEGNLVKPKDQAVNKIGHALHVLSEPFTQVTLSEENASMARSLGFRDPRVLQSMVICKNPEIGGSVPPHQDSTFLYTSPPSAVGFWYALEDARADNGCLSFAPGSHLRRPVAQRFVRSARGGTEFLQLADPRWPEDGLAYAASADDDEATTEEYRMEEVKAGSLVLIHGNVLHKSEKNGSDRSRFIYTFHVIEGKHDYDERNWLQPGQDGFARLYR